MIGFIIRNILTLTLIGGVYSETGIWTALFAALVWAAIEVQVANITRINARLRGRP